LLSPSSPGRSSFHDGRTRRDSGWLDVGVARRRDASPGRQGPWRIAGSVPGSASPCQEAARALGSTATPHLRLTDGRPACAGEMQFSPLPRHSRSVARRCRLGVSRDEARWLICRRTPPSRRSRATRRPRGARRRAHAPLDAVSLARWPSTTSARESRVSVEARFPAAAPPRARRGRLSVKRAGGARAGRADWASDAGQPVRGPDRRERARDSAGSSRLRRRCGQIWSSKPRGAVLSATRHRWVVRGVPVEWLSVLDKMLVRNMRSDVMVRPDRKARGGQECAIPGAVTVRAS
jgi:hypothetical protein